MERVECKDLALRAEQEDLRGYKETPLETVSPRCGLLGSPESLYLVAMRDGAGEYRGVEGRPVAERSSQMQDGRQLSCGASVAATPGAASPAAGPAPTLPSLRCLAPSDPVTFSPSTFPKKITPSCGLLGRLEFMDAPFQSSGLRSSRPGTRRTRLRTSRAPAAFPIPGAYLTSVALLSLTISLTLASGSPLCIVHVPNFDTLPFMIHYGTKTVYTEERMSVDSIVAVCGYLSVLRRKPAVKYYSELCILRRCKNSDC